jgi:hypothetical protein
MTSILHLARTNWKTLTKEAQIKFKSYFTQKNKFSDPLKVKIFDKGNFRYHFMTEGEESENVSKDDANEDGVPDYIETVSKILDSCYYNYHIKYGYTIPPPDSIGLDSSSQYGGSSKYDVYISSKLAEEQNYGYVATLNSISHNPNSEIEGKVYSSYMVLRSEYSKFPGTIERNLQVTCAHEYMHSIQYGYQKYFSRWYGEMFATWGENFLYPKIGDNLQYIPNLFSYIDFPLNIEQGFDNNIKWYGTWLFAQYLTEQTNDSIVKQIYEEAKKKNYTQTQDELYSFDNILNKKWDTDFRTIFKNFAFALPILSNDTSYKPFIFKDAIIYKGYLGNKFDKLFEEEIIFNQIQQSWDSQTDGDRNLYRLGMDYFKIIPLFGLEIDFINNDKEIELYLIKQNKEEISITKTNNQNKIIYEDIKNWDKSYITVIRHNYFNDIDGSKQYKFNLNILDKTKIPTKTKPEIKIGPNPCSSTLTIKNITPNSKIYLIDISGRRVFKKLVRNDNIQLNTFNFSNGVYLLKIEHKNDILIKKITILHD